MNVCIDKTVPLAASAKEAVSHNPENIPSLGIPTQLGNWSPDARFAAFLLTGKKWKTGEAITIGFIGGDETVRRRIREHAELWLRYANLSFLWVEDYRKATIRISFDQNDGSWSYIGTDARTIKNVEEATMNFGWLDPDTDDAEYSRVVLHEFGHMLGMPHEHNHPKVGIPWDREAVYAYYMKPPNSWSKADVDNNLFAVYSESNTSFGEFDPNSIMIYSIPNSLTVGDYEVGWNTTLSKSDIAFIGQQYPKPYDPPPEKKLATVQLSQFNARKPTREVGVMKSGKKWAIARPWN